MTTNRGFQVIELSKATPRRSLIVLVFLVVISSAVACRSNSDVPRSPPIQSEKTMEMVKQADDLYAQRSDLNRVREAIELLRPLQANDNNRYEVMWRLAKLNYFVGENSGSESEREGAFKEGILAAKTATNLEPNRPEGHFWLGANIGGQAEMKGLLRSLMAVTEIRQEMETVVKLDEKYLGASAYMVLGRIDLELPGFLGGDVQRAIKNLERGNEVDDGNHQMRLLLAKAYLKANRKAEAKRQLLIILEMPADPNHIPEYNKTVEEARQVLSKNF